MKTALALYLKGFISLFFPKFCVVCRASLLGNEEVLCTVCRHSLPETGYHKSRGNPVEQLFWGRLPVEFASSLIYFDKGSTYRQLIHQLKYKGRKDVGLFLGRMLGSSLKNSELPLPDYIIPVPLHRRKLKRRGYNQSEVIARGMAQILKCEVNTSILKRVKFTNTQTTRKRYERWENVESVFSCAEGDQLCGKHILLVDDVVTTGATLEASANQLLKFPDTRVSIATLCFAHI